METILGEESQGWVGVNVLDTPELDNISETTFFVVDDASLCVEQNLSKLVDEPHKKAADTSKSAPAAGKLARRTTLTAPLMMSLCVDHCSGSGSL